MTAGVGGQGGQVGVGLAHDPAVDLVRAVSAVDLTVATSLHVDAVSALAVELGAGARVEADCDRRSAIGVFRAVPIAVFPKEVPVLGSKRVLSHVDPRVNVWTVVRREFPSDGDGVPSQKRRVIAAKAVTLVV